MKVNDDSSLPTKKENHQDHQWFAIYSLLQTRPHSIQQKSLKTDLAKMAEEQDGEITFSSTNSLKEQQNGEQSLQNNFWSLAADIRRPEKQPIVFEGR